MGDGDGDGLFARRGVQLFSGIADMQINRDATNAQVLADLPRPHAVRKQGDNLDFPRRQTFLDGFSATHFMFLVEHVKIVSFILSPLGETYRHPDGISAA